MSADGIARILVIDDEPQIRKFLRISLNAYGYEVVEAVRGEDGIGKCATADPDLVILDLGLPDLDGQEVITRIREWSKVPIIVLSVRAGEAEKVAALDHGADDYVTKPFGIHELLARVRATLRSRRQDGEPLAVVTVRDLMIDIPRRRVQLAGVDIKLSRKEFAILRLLAQHAGRIVTHQHLLREVWARRTNTRPTICASTSGIYARSSATIPPTRATSATSRASAIGCLRAIAGVLHRGTAVPHRSHHILRSGRQNRGARPVNTPAKKPHPRQGFPPALA
jgi:two-component system KDP operon response regulator KdpE